MQLRYPVYKISNTNERTCLYIFVNAYVYVFMYVYSCAFVSAYLCVDI